jgi:hypothetical protein
MVNAYPKVRSLKKKQYSYYSVNKFTYGIIHGFDKNEPG